MRRHDGTAVTVRVQRPGFASTVEGDISMLRQLARLARTLMPLLRGFDLPDLVEELAETLRGQLDLERAARNVERFAQISCNAGGQKATRDFARGPEGASAERRSVGQIKTVKRSLFGWAPAEREAENLT